MIIFVLNGFEVLVVIDFCLVSINFEKRKFIENKLPAFRI
jgi:hypothetical protein